MDKITRATVDKPGHPKRGAAGGRAGGRPGQKETLF
jgi:hypothetical protein